MRIENLDNAREVHQGPRQTVDLVDYHYVNSVFLDLLKKLLKVRALHRATGKASVFILLRQQLPAFAGLGADKGLTRFTLRM